MSKKDNRKVRRIEIEKVKNGKDGKKGHLHKVTAHYHDAPAKEGKGMKNAFPKYEPPEETFHTSPKDMHKHVKGLVDHMTATPDEPFQQAAAGGVDADDDNGATEDTTVG